MRVKLWLVLAASMCLRAADDAPGWLRELATAKLPAYAADVPAVVLLDEERLTVDDSGRLTSTARTAVRILNREGRSRAVASVTYLSSGSKVKELHAWMVLPSGEAKRYGKEKVVDLSLVRGEIYDEYRVRAIDAQEDAANGSVFGFETVTERKSFVPQHVWDFQDRLPVRLSRFALTLPNGWEATGAAYNHAAVPPSVEGSTSTWELRDLPYLKRETASPALAALAPRLAVTWHALDQAKPLRAWPDVSRWMTPLNESQRQPSPELTAKVQELIAGQPTAWGRVQAISRYIQKLKYVSIQMNLARGGGYRPHAAADVFQKQYGDCKDKANLMITMLSAAGIESYPLAIYSGDPTYVRPEWASPLQFNHQIVAIAIPADVKANAVVAHPQLGRLLIFDATDPITPIGELPEHEQDSHALLIAGDKGILLQMPISPPGANQSRRETHIVLTPEGTAEVESRDQRTGQVAADARGRLRNLTPVEYRQNLESWISAGATGAAVSAVEPLDVDPAGHFALKLAFRAPGYGKLMQGRLLMFRPAILLRENRFPLEDKPRQHPVLLRPEDFSETITVELPAGFKVDELPEGETLESDFGRFQTTWTVKGQQLLFTRHLEVRHALLPAKEYARVRDFFTHVMGAEQAPVVLAK